MLFNQNKKNHLIFKITLTSSLFTWHGNLKKDTNAFVFLTKFSDTKILIPNICMIEIGSSKAARTPT